MDPYTNIKFLAHSYEKSFPGPSRTKAGCTGLTFMLFLHLWMRSFEITPQLFFSFQDPVRTDRLG